MGSAEHPELVRFEKGAESGGFENGWHHDVTWREAPSMGAVLRAVQVVVDERVARPILVGRPAVIESRISRFNLRLKAGEHFDIVNPEYDRRYREYWEDYRARMARRGMTEQFAKIEMRRRTTLIGSMLLKKGEGDGLVCGTFGTTGLHLKYIDQVIGRRSGASVYAAMNALILPGRQLFIADTHVNLDPTAAEIAEITLMAAESIRRFGIEPKAALLSHSNFGTHEDAAAAKMREALALIRDRAPDLEVDGEMHGDAALDEAHRMAILPESTLSGAANLLIGPNLGASNIAYNLLKTAAGQNVAIGPLLLGCAAPVNILTVRRIINVAALTVLEAQQAAGDS